MINKIRYAVVTLTFLAVTVLTATALAQSFDINSDRMFDLTKDSKVQEVSYGYGETFECTFYGPSVGSIAALGNEIYEGCIAVDPSVIPLGSTVYVEFPSGYEYLNGSYYACDTGGAIYGNIIDVFLNMSETELNRLGRITVTVYR